MKTKPLATAAFTTQKESTDIANSIVDFASSLVQVINTAPSGTITVPENPYQAGDELPFAYLPMLEPSIDTASSIWGGNLKKYV